VHVRTQIVIAAAAVVLVALGVWQWEWNTGWLEAWIRQHALLGAGLYVVLVAASVVVLPFSSLPLLPLATRWYGVPLTAVLSATGWWVGCLLAFQIARLGRPYLERVTSLDAVDRLADKVPADLGFGGIVMLRLILPVDVVSFALGLVKRLTFRTYAAASLTGILPFAFVWSYAGGELGASRFWSFAVVMIGMTAATVALRRVWLSR